MSKLDVSIGVPSVPTMSVPAAGRLFGLGRDASYRAAAEGLIPLLRFGRLLRVPTAAVRQMLRIDPETGERDEREAAVAGANPKLLAGRGTRAETCGSSEAVPQNGKSPP